MIRAIRDGLPGSAMPPWGHLPEEDLQALLMAVKHLAVEGKVRALRESAEDSGTPMTPAEAAQIAQRLFAPGPTVNLPSPVPKTDSRLARGRDLYKKMCVSCHALEGGVSPKRDMRDDTGAFIYPRNFKSGLFLRATNDEALALTILRGLPGTPMPAYPLPPDDLWPLVHFVRSLAEPDSAPEPADAPPARRITLTGVADPGVWTEDAIEVGYQGTAPVSPAQIVVREGEDVVLELKSADVTHGFYSPELGIGPIEVYPGHSRTVRLKVPSPGEYEFYCMNMCGHCHFSMKGSILVLPAGTDAPREDFVRQCEHIPEVPADASVVEKGKVLYRKMACATCHGEEGRGGIKNVNALPTEEVPSLDRLAEKLMLWGPKESDVRAVLDWLEQGKGVIAALDDPRYDSFLRQYETLSQSIREGQVTPPKNPAGPDPPLQMPAMEARLSPEEVDAVMAYLVSLYDGAGSEPISQVIAFNHRLHIEEVGADCMDCHESVLEDQRAGVPTNETCLGCHDPGDLDDSTSTELRAVFDYLQKEVEIPWNRVHDLPGHVTFPHSRHVTAGNIGCAQCHGDLAQRDSPPERPAFNLKMNWCLDCHDQEEATNDCRACHP
jgi:mono/diheme cytochrome c family protein/plastocyanin